MAAACLENPDFIGPDQKTASHSPDFKKPHLCKILHKFQTTLSCCINLIPLFSTFLPQIKFSVLLKESMEYTLN
jgi:hypothetical protein